MPESSRSLSAMAFDFGTRWIGVAVGQSMLGTGRAVARLKARDGIPDWQQVAALVEEWQPEVFVVGLPLNMDDSESALCQRARKFAKRLHGRYHRPAEMMDERLTTFQAKREVIDRSGQRDFGVHGIDDRAAELILEGWFASRITAPTPGSSRQAQDANNGGPADGDPGSS